MRSHRSQGIDEVVLAWADELVLSCPTARILARDRPASPHTRQRPAVSSPDPQRGESATGDPSAAKEGFPAGPSPEGCCSSPDSISESRGPGQAGARTEGGIASLHALATTLRRAPRARRIPGTQINE